MHLCQLRGDVDPGTTQGHTDLRHVFHWLASDRVQSRRSATARRPTGPEVAPVLLCCRGLGWLDLLGPRLLEMHQIWVVLLPAWGLVCEVLRRSASQHIGLLRYQMWHVLVLWAHRGRCWKADRDFTIDSVLGIRCPTASWVLMTTDPSSTLKGGVGLANSIWYHRVVHLLLSRLLRRQVLTHICETLLERIIWTELDGLLFIWSTLHWGLEALVVRDLIEWVALLWKVDYARLNVLVHAIFVQAVMWLSIGAASGEGLSRNWVCVMDGRSGFIFQGLFRLVIWNPVSWLLRACSASWGSVLLVLAVYVDYHSFICRLLDNLATTHLWNNVFPDRRRRLRKLLLLRGRQELLFTRVIIAIFYLLCVHDFSVAFLAVEARLFSSDWLLLWIFHYDTSL